ncbi:MAG: trypsin-like peptidase domain-containing protein [Candidatus Hydrogenedentes bacterium]|jgi:hypothetical protein|nr:trypsin-like peptidase domain-containing protein [Candidatus Hydrogenedentota bacterium]
MKSISIVAALLALPFCLAVPADDLAEAMRGAVAKNDAAVVTVKVALKETYSYDGGSDVNEYTQDITATVISPEGLMVTSLMVVDPSVLMEEYANSEEGFDSKTEITSLKVRRGEAEEDAEIVLRDRDLDLAFLRPVKKPAEPRPFTDLAAGAQAKAFDPVIVMNRLGKVANRVSTAQLLRIDAVLDKPRMTYFVGEYAGHGAPVFVVTGECLGINVTKMLKTNSQNGMGVADEYESNMASVVISGADVLEVAKQVPAYKEN